ncbi:MAG: hypothetical protein LJE92_12225 [Gammaproteobacteria bacterium]|jgi:hypothetical protein|nr:hypothetical protein [Gammaproteobacteria bacterium]
MNSAIENSNIVSGEFINMAGERYYAIRNVDQMAPFFISVVSNSDHWLFISSSGGLTAGRVSPENALFPYITVDQIHRCGTHTGSKTLLRVEVDGEPREWEPFNREHDGRYQTSRNLYKNTLGNKLCFQEINHDLQLSFSYTWATSETYGFARQCELSNLAVSRVRVELVDGLQNILPAGTPLLAQTTKSNLVDAYKWNELDEATGLALFTLYSGISDRAEPCESLQATTVFCLGLDKPRVLLSASQLEQFRLGKPLIQETHTRGIRGAYLVNAALELASGASRSWQIVADLERSQSQAVDLRKQLQDPAAVAKTIAASIARGADELGRIMARGDGFQASAEETVSVHHYANVLFNILRGGAFDDQYQVSSRDFANTIKGFNRDVFQRNETMLRSLPEQVEFRTVLAAIEEQGDRQLERLACEYLPITFGRRHGDPSRPWNQFAIKLRDSYGNRLLSYEGNWRDIFQNWEALALSYPEFIENIISKFVNASTLDGYNPYRITKEGIDWEVEEPDDPWSYIGYWGDHQIIYLLKLLEISRQYHPDRLGDLLHQPIFSYANVPYKIKPFAALLENAKSTVVYDEALAQQIEERVERLGADGKLLLDGDGQVYQVTLLEKLLVPLLCKLGNLVLDGGIWLNTQRPEWNDANNALVGQGLSMVTLYYMRRYISFMQQLLADASGAISISVEVSRWLEETAVPLRELRPNLGAGPVTAELRFQLLQDLGQAASRYREALYQQGAFTGCLEQELGQVTSMLDDAQAAIDHCISTNQREDGLYQAYNLLALSPQGAEVNTLYPMLEGQVAALSAGAIDPGNAVKVLEALFASDVYRPDQHSFMLYPDRKLPGFLDKNRIPAAQVEAIPLLSLQLQRGDRRMVERDADGCYRFNSEFTNIGDLNAQLQAIADDYSDQPEAGFEQSRQPIAALYEQVFNHQAFTGRSGGMFGFEGLGCIYWHMVSKLLVAVEENFFAALQQDADSAVIQQLGKLYYRIRKGIGFNKTPEEYGAFPTDPYSHTPTYAGAQQPGMTGQVKEEILTRFRELGICVDAGAVTFAPRLLREREFTAEPGSLRYLDVDDQWQELAVPTAGLAFTWCQVPLVYVLDNDAEPSVTVTRDDGSCQTLPGLALPAETSAEIFQRSGRIRRLDLVFDRGELFSG